MSQRIALFAVLLSISAASPLLSGDTGSACLDELRTIYDKLNHPAGGDQRCYFIDYSFDLRVRDSTQLKNSVSRTAMMVCGDKMRVQSTGMNVYQDRRHIVAVLPEQQSILIRASRRSAPAADERNAYLLLQDSLLAFCRVSACRDYRDTGGRELREMELHLRPGRQHFGGLQSLHVLIDRQRELPVALTLYYTTDHAIERLKVTYHKIDYNYEAPADLAKPALSFVMDRRQRLRREFGGYRLLDLRAE